MAYICRTPESPIWTMLVADPHGLYKGECVSLVKLQCPFVPVTSMWRKGAHVMSAKALAPGTAIATFEGPGGKYQGHAAILVSKDAGGIWVWDQYNTPPKGVGQRYIRINASGKAVNDAGRYYVIE